MKSKLRSYLVLSDIHLGARSTSAFEIIEHLLAFFYNFSDNSELAEVDAVIIAGDLWDNTVQMSSDTLKLFIPFFNRLLNWCGRNNIALIVLEGTPLHDRGQSGTLISLHDVIGAKVDFRYISTLSIEYIEKLGLSILFVPDECRSTAELVVEDAEQLLIEKGLDKVDIAIMHGVFKYQLGTIPMSHKVYDEGWFLDHVRHYINIGHIHKASQYGRILAQGSFDRLRHGEEEPKGAFLIKEISENEWAHFFIENKLAKTYIDVNIKGSVDDALKKIEKQITKLSKGSYVRILGETTHPIFQGFETLRLKYPDYFFSKKTKGKEEVVVQQEEKTYHAVVLNRETLTQAVLKEVTALNELGSVEQHKLQLLIESLHED